MIRSDIWTHGARHGTSQLPVLVMGHLQALYVKYQNGTAAYCWTPQRDTACPLQNLSRHYTFRAGATTVRTLRCRVWLQYLDAVQPRAIAETNRRMRLAESFLGDAIRVSCVSLTPSPFPAPLYLATKYLSTQYSVDPIDTVHMYAYRGR